MRVQWNRNSKLSYTPQFLTLDNTPWFSLMGEIHYSRVSNGRWEEELYKMKAGGIELVSAYTIWIHHEEVEGEWDFSGDRDLRKPQSAWLFRGGKEGWNLRISSSWSVGTRRGKKRRISGLADAEGKRRAASNKNQ